MLRAMSAAIHRAICFHAVADDPATTVQASGRETRNGAFEAVKGMLFAAIERHGEGLVVIVAAGFAFHG